MTHSHPKSRSLVYAAIASLTLGAIHMPLALARTQGLGTQAGEEVGISIGNYTYDEPGYMDLKAVKLAHRSLEGTGLAADRTRDPVDRTQLVEDGALDSSDGVGLELVAASRVELLDRIDETEHAETDEVRLFDVARQADAHTTGDILHQRRILDDQLVAQVLGAGPLVVGPQSFGLRGVVAHSKVLCAGMG